VATDRARRRCLERLRLLGSSRLSREEFTAEALGALRQAIGFDGPSCWVLADPASLLPAGHEMTGADAALQAAVPRLTALHQGHEAASDRAAAGGDAAVAALSMSTGGDLAQSQLWDECMRPHGVGDCFFLACRDRYGSWGWVNASRERSDRPFAAEDVRLLNDVSASLGAAMRRLATGDSGPPADSPPPGVIICDHRLRETGWTPAAHRWLARLPDGPHWQRRGLLPPAVYGVVGRLLAAAEEAAGGTARARIRTTSGTWAVLDGSRLEGEAGGRVAITVRAATADEVLEVLCRAYELTPRERELVRLVVGGLRTQRLAERLCITPYTVKDHLKAVFEKVGVRSRGELVGRMTGHARVPDELEPGVQPRHVQ
jgi:DNA-binding CsgD family transcriptional regulator